MQDVLDVGQLVLPAPRGMPDPAADPDRRKDHKGHKYQQHPGKTSSQLDHDHGGKNEDENLLQEFRHHRSHGELDLLHVVHDCRNQRAGRIFLEEGHGASQQRIV